MLNRRSLLTSLGCAALAVPIAGRSAAGGVLKAPSSTPILRVTGAISARNSAHAAVFDRAMIEELGTSEIATRTPWYTDRVRFEGPLMHRLIDLLGATGTTLKVRALNDYQTEIPISDFRSFGVILALKRDGKYMEVRDKGPLFIVYPFDSDPMLHSQKYYSRSPWQIAHMEIA